MHLFSFITARYFSATDTGVPSYLVQTVSSSQHISPGKQEEWSALSSHHDGPSLDSSSLSEGGDEEVGQDACSPAETVMSSSLCVNSCLWVGVYPPY